MNRVSHAENVPLMLMHGKYERETLLKDLLAGAVVAIMLIPQSLAYALLAGLPAEMGLYASIVPLVAYALIGSSRTLSVGPVAVISLMTAAALGDVASQGTADYATAATALALLSGAMMVIMGCLRFGFLTNFLSHSVVSGFITAAGVLIALSQLRHILGIDAAGGTAPALLASLAGNLSALNATTLVIGAGSVLWLVWSRVRLAALIEKLGTSKSLAAIAAKAAPLMVVIATAAASGLFGLESKGVAIVGEIPSGLPAFSVPLFNLDLWASLWVPALLISVIGFVESVSVGKTLAAQSQDRINPNRELIALGAANLGAAVSSGFPVTGGIARSMVNHDAGAATQMASIFAALGITLATLFLTPALYYLPKATLAATIVVAVSTLLNIRAVKRAWLYSRTDFIAITLTILVTLLLGVELGVLSGIVASVGLHLYKTSKPHVAVVGAVPGTEHYRSVNRHQVVTYPSLLSLRVDESLYFVNTSFLETCIEQAVADSPGLEHVILQCTAVNEIDLSALEVLEQLDLRLTASGIQLHLSEVKGPVMDALQRYGFPEQLSGEVFLTHHQAVSRLKPDLIEPYIP